MIGHDLMSKTSNIRTIRMPHRNRPGKYICFVDTPGFDDSKRSDYDILASNGMFMIQRCALVLCPFVVRLTSD